MRLCDGFGFILRCPLSKDAGKYVVEQILSGKPREDIVNEIHEYLSNLSTNVS